jgi:MFS family permease
MSSGPQGRGSVRRLAVARVVSSTGSQAAQVALVYQVYASTHSGAWVVAALFASISVSGLLSPLSGWAADHFDRRRLMVRSELAAGLAYLCMMFVHAPGPLMAAALGATMLGAPFRAASAAAVPNLVAAEDVAWANALLGTAFNVALVAGPFLGGALIAASGARAVFAVNAVTFGISAALIAATRASFTSAAPRPAEGRERPNVMEGFRLLGHDRLLRGLAASSSLAFAAFGAALVLDPVLARHFHAGSVGYGLLTAVWGGGAVLGALVAGRVVSVDGAPRAVVFGTAAMAVSLGGIVFMPSFALIVAAGAIGGAGSGFVSVPSLLLVQHRASDMVRGRVIAAAEAFDQTAFLAGMGIAVPVLAGVGAQRAYALAGLLLGAAALAALRAIPVQHNTLRPSLDDGTVALAGVCNAGDVVLRG